MERKISIVLIAFMLVSMLVPTASASPLTWVEVNGDAAYESTIAYTRYGNYAIYGYLLASNGNIALIVVDDTGSVVLQKQISVSGENYYKYAAMDLDANDTGILIAYRTAGDDVYLYWVGFDGSERDLGALVATSNYEGLPIVKYGNGYWLLGYVDDTADELVVGIYDLTLTEIVKKSFPIGGYGGVDYRERAFYDPVSGKFYIVAKNSTLPDLTLIIADPSGPSISYARITSDSAAECQSYYGKLYRKFYAQLLDGGRYLLVVYGYYSGSTRINATIIDLQTLSNTTITISDVGGDTNFYPWISASSSEWLLSWSYLNNIYVVFIYPNATTSNTFTLAMGSYGYITSTYNGVDYTVVYGNESTGNYDLYAIRLDTIGKRSLTPLRLTYTGNDENTEFPITVGTKTVVFFFNWTGSYTGLSYLAIFDYTEVPEPSAIPTRIDVSTLTLNDGGDGYMNAEDYVSLQGSLIDTSTGNGLASKTIEIYLYRYVFYNTKIHGDEDILVATNTTTTNSLGYFTAEIHIPNTAKSGIYYVMLRFPGEDPYAESTWTSQEDYGFFIVGPVKPSTITWETIPSDIAVGPALLIKNGQVIITDPEGEPQTDVRQGTRLADLLGSEIDDVDIRSMQIAVDSNYLYINATFTGLATATDNYAPVLAIAFDFTPETLDDGADFNRSGNFRLVYGMGYSDTYLKSGCAWDWILVATPKDRRGYVFQDEFGKYSLYMYIAFNSGGEWYFRELDAGYVVLNGNTMLIYAPLDIVKEYNPHIATTGISSWKMFSAVFAVDLSTGYRVSGVPGGNWFDVPGVVTYNTTPTAALDIGVWESALDDRLDSTYELDTYFILNINWSLNKFFAYTKLELVKSYITPTGYSPLEYSYHKAYLGTMHYLYKLVDANNTHYGVYGKNVTWWVNGSIATSGLTGVVDSVNGLVDIAYKWTPDTLNKTYVVKAVFSGDSDYMGSETSEYSVKPLYLIDVVGGSAAHIDTSGAPTVSEGDIIRIVLYVRAWYDEWIDAPEGLRFRVYLNSTPYFLGYAVVRTPGVATLEYVVTGDENIYDTAPITHSILVYGDLDTTYLITPISIDFPYHLAMIPMPEPTMLPLVLLAVLFIILWIKRRK